MAILYDQQDEWNALFGGPTWVNTRVFHDKLIWQNICQTKKSGKNKFTKKWPPVGFDLPTATITALKSDA